MSSSNIGSNSIGIFDVSFTIISEVNDLTSPIILLSRGCPEYDIRYSQLILRSSRVVFGVSEISEELLVNEM